MKTRVRVGGDLNTALRGEYQLDVNQILQEGWEITKKSKSNILKGLAVIIMTSLLVSGVVLELSGQENFQEMSEGDRFLLDIIITVLLAPIIASLSMMGISHSVGAITRPAYIFHFVAKSLPIVITTLVTTAVVHIGFLLLILPGVYLLVATGFAIPLLLDKQLRPSESVITSIRVVNHQWFAFVKIYLFFLVLGLLSIVTFGIALVWVAPYYYNVKGILYRNVFGVDVHIQTSDDQELRADDIFHA